MLVGMTAQNITAPFRLKLLEVTLCAVTSVNIEATVRALSASMEQIDFGECLLFTDLHLSSVPAGIRLIHVEKICSSESYSTFVLKKLADYVTTSHCLIIQWDGYVKDATFWSPDFLSKDYVGARWPQFNDGLDVGNGGFSLRSRHLLHLCRHPDFRCFHPEDVCIGRGNRAWLESQGIHFATAELADRFSVERAGDISRSFGFHGVWNMPAVAGVDAFWAVYRGLDDRGTIKRDFAGLLRHVLRGKAGIARALRFTFDHLKARLGSAKRRQSMR